jgi:hypothetical protein
MQNLIEIARHCASCDLDWCANCPYGATTSCRDELLTALANKLEGLESAYNSCLEALEEYEKAERDREEMYKPIFTTTSPLGGTFYGKGGEWTMTFDATSDSEYSIATASSGCCDESWTTTSASSTDVKEYVLDSYKSLHERVITDLEKPSPRKKWYQLE